MKEIKKVTVKYHGRIVGYLAEIDETIAFEYDKEWIDNGFPISPLSLPLSNKTYKDGNKLIFNGLYGVFNDSLPDGWGALLLIRMLAKKGINYDKVPPLNLLMFIQKNGLGALEYEPSKPLLDSFSSSFNLDELSMEANKIMNEEDKYDLDYVYMYGGSSGGARPKAHIKYQGEEWIVKFPSRIDSNDIGKREYEANRLAKLCNINVNEFTLFESKLTSGYFAAKRFDRKNGKKVHMISLAAILETSHRYYNLDYMHLFKVIKSISVDNDDLYEAFKRMCFNVFYLNRDDHSKNFAFLYDEEKGGYVLSPFYDITQTKNQIEHSMTINGSGNPSEEDLLEVAKRFDLSLKKCKEIISKIKQVIKENSK